MYTHQREKPSGELTGLSRLLILGGGILVVFAIWFWTAAYATIQEIDKPSGHGYALHAPVQTYELQHAATPEDQIRGLSGRTSLGKGSGMLFVFPEQSRQCFWMKDMNFPIDIIWADAGKRITYVKERASPGTYPEQFCADAKYVIELNAGESGRNRFAVGQKLDF